MTCMYSDYTEGRSSRASTLCGIQETGTTSNVQDNTVSPRIDDSESETEPKQTDKPQSPEMLVRYAEEATEEDVTINDDSERFQQTVLLPAVNTPYYNSDATAADNNNDFESDCVT